MDDQLKNTISMMARLRRDKERLKQTQKNMLDRVLSSEVYRENEEELEQIEAALHDLEAAAREQALTAFIMDGDKHPHPAVTVKMLTRMDYDIHQATVWARENLPEAIHLDTRFFEKHAKAVQSTQPVPCVTVTMEPQAQISGDLASWLTADATVDDAVGVEGEMEF